MSQMRIPRPASHLLCAMTVIFSFVIAGSSIGLEKAGQSEAVLEFGRGNNGSPVNIQHIDAFQLIPKFACKSSLCAVPA